MFPEESQVRDFRAVLKHVWETSRANRHQDFEATSIHDQADSILSLVLQGPEGKAPRFIGAKKTP